MTTFDFTPLFRTAIGFDRLARALESANRADAGGYPPYNIELTGVIVEARLGNPHGILQVQADDEVWTVEVGQPWRNEQAGLAEGDLAAGVEATFIGEPSANVADRLLKAERIVIGGRLFDLYPNRS